MARKLRYVPRDGVVEIALRCADGEMLLAPNVELRRRLLGVLGRALHLYPVLLHAYQFMSNHLHMLMTVADACRMAKFMGYLAKQGGDAIRDVRGTRWVWESRYWHRCLVTDEEAAARLRYILSNGVKEGLVDRPEDWPGISSTPALLADGEVQVRWSTAAQRRAAALHGADADSVGTPYVITLTPLPALAKHGAPRFRAILFAMCRDIEREGRIQRENRPSLGVDAVCATDPHSRHALEPCGSKARSRGDRARRQWQQVVERVTADHRRATELRRAGEDGRYPPGCFAPSGQFTPWPADSPSGHLERQPLRGSKRRRSRRDRSIGRTAESDLLVPGVDRER
jgi:putative transposase